MISGQIIYKSIEELHAITKVDFSVYEIEGNMVCSTCEPDPETAAAVRAFSDSPADSQDVRGSHFFKIYDEIYPGDQRHGRGFPHDGQGGGEPDPESAGSL